MGTEIAILYADLSVMRVSWNERYALKRNAVLAVAILHEGKIRQSSISHDWYYLIWTDNDCCLTGHDGDYDFHSLTDPEAGIDWRFPFILPNNSIEFTTDDAYVSKEVWQTALKIFADAEGPMF